MKGRVLVHNGKYVDVDKLGDGIFYTDNPTLLPPSIKNLEELIFMWRYQKEFFPSQIVNLMKCKLLKTSTKYG